MWDYLRASNLASVIVICVHGVSGTIPGGKAKQARRLGAWERRELDKSM